MRTQLPEYYRPSEDEFKRMWETATFVFDASALLNLYRYTKATADAFLKTLEALRERVWLPYQAAMEFHRSREKVIQNEMRAYQDVAGALATAESTLQKVLDRYRYHPAIELSDLMHKAIEPVRNRLDQLRSAHPTYDKGDQVLETLTGFFGDDRVGQCFDGKRIEEIVRDGRFRYENKIPPGYEDRKKETDIDRFGDLIMWLQVIDYAKTVRRPIIFITDDDKDDWWLKAGGKTVGPRPELAREMRAEANVLFYAYAPSEFLRYADKFLNAAVSDNAIQEVQAVSAEETEQSHSLKRRRSGWVERVRQAQERHFALMEEQSSIYRELAVLATSPDSKAKTTRMNELAIRLSNMEFEISQSRFCISELHGLQLKELEDDEERFRKGIP